MNGSHELKPLLLSFPLFCWTQYRTKKNEEVRYLYDECVIVDWLVPAASKMAKL